MYNYCIETCSVFVSTQPLCWNKFFLCEYVAIVLKQLSVFVSNLAIVVKQVLSL